MTKMTQSEQENCKIPTLSKPFIKFRDFGPYEKGTLSRGTSPTHFCLSDLQGIIRSSGPEKGHHQNKVNGDITTNKNLRKQ